MSKLSSMWRQWASSNEYPFAADQTQKLLQKAKYENGLSESFEIVSLYFNFIVAIDSDWFLFPERNIYIYIYLYYYH